MLGQWRPQLLSRPLSYGGGYPRPSVGPWIIVGGPGAIIVVIVWAVVGLWGRRPVIVEAGGKQPIIAEAVADDNPSVHRSRIVGGPSLLLYGQRGA